MSFSDGWSALNLEAPKRVPHTEYSITTHWDVLRRVTGIPVSAASPITIRDEAAREFMRRWNFDLAWSILLQSQPFGDLRTDMGHAVYESDGSDWRETVHCPFTDPEQVLNFDFFAAYGEPDIPVWTQRFTDHYRANRAALPDQVTMTGIYTTLISGFIDVFGWDMLLQAAASDQKRFGSLADRYADWMLGHFRALAKCEAPVVMVHDDIVWSSGAFINPRWYRSHVFPNYARLFAPLREAGKKILFTSDGDYTKFIDDLADCGVHGLILEPFTDMQYIADHYGDKLAFIGNADTRILLSGTRAEIRAEVERCMRIGKDCPGFFLAVGNHIPSNTPVDSVLWYEECYEELCWR